MPIIKFRETDYQFYDVTLINSLCESGMNYFVKNRGVELKLGHSCASQVPKKHRYFATFHSANYHIFPASIAMKNNCFYQTSYGEEVHQCMVSSFHCIEE